MPVPPVGVTGAAAQVSRISVAGEGSQVHCIRRFSSASRYRSSSQVTPSMGVLAREKGPQPRRGHWRGRLKESRPAARLVRPTLQLSALVAEQARGAESICQGSGAQAAAEHPLTSARSLADSFGKGEIGKSTS